MGHRREVFRPKSRKQVRDQILNSINNREYEKAVKIASFSYSRAPIADDFSISFLASTEAIRIGRELNWSRSSDEIALIGLTLTETKLDTNVNRTRRQIIIDSISKAVELAKKEAGK